MALFFEHLSINHRYYPTFFIGMIALNFIAAIYYWHTKSLALLLVPLLTSCIPRFTYFSTIIFCCTALYCTLNQHFYCQEQIGLANKILSGNAYVQEIYFNESKNIYRLTCDFTPENTDPSLRIHIFTSEKPTFQPADYIYIKNIRFNESPANAYRNYLLKEGIYATAYVKKINFEYQKTTAQIPIKNFLYRLENRIFTKLTDRAQMLFSSLFLGAKTYTHAADITIKKYFNAWGINHFLARSGLHVSLIMITIVGFLRIFPVSIYVLYGATALLVLLYTLLSYTSVSFFRAIIATYALLWKQTNKVPIDSLHILMITTIFFLLYNPFYVLFLDFQLTFLLTFGLCLLNPLKAKT